MGEIMGFTQKKMTL